MIDLVLAAALTATAFAPGLASGDAPAERVQTTEVAVEPEVAVPTPVPVRAAAEEPGIESTEVLVVSPVLSLPHFWASASIPDLDCPSGMQLRLTGYHDGSGLRVPWGVEVRFIGGWGPDVATLTKGENLPSGFRPTGIRAGTTTNWASGPRWIQVVLHCMPYS
ncbi:hypothetical protein [Agromyces aerolatus]|uniref:hypothetical protein n=1 Tax=Agromyces sp. LY-1074 TaxID=3074080 RepID=UPI002858806E|nr:MULTISPECIES: hypothetical protein [unclassified Agromyces]MDR5700057.1 hypothetical protein [Agromyces sp. LY-1074]MDR5706575.1 hypothetical protein [Agromyces sp. LY-1358]